MNQMFFFDLPFFIIKHFVSLRNKTKIIMTMKSIIRFIRSTNGVFAPKSPMDNPAFAEFYASIMENPYSDPNNDRINLRNDMIRFGSDFKKATKMAKEMLNVE